MVGQPMTWLVRLQAVGLLGKQISLPDFAVPQGFRTYHEDPKRTNNKVNGQVAAVYERRTALIPEAAGDYKLPPLKLPWWNTTTDSLQYATLPEQVMKVSPSATASVPAGLSTNAPAATESPAGLSSPGTPEEPTTASSSSSPVPSSSGLTYPILSMAFLILWLMTMAAWWRERRQRLTGQASAQHQLKEKQESIAALRRDLRNACRQGDAQTARQKLLAWGRATWPVKPPVYLEELAKRMPVLHTPVEDLNHCLYRSSPSTWRGEKLWQAFDQGYKDVKRPDHAHSDLEPLYRL